MRIVRREMMQLNSQHGGYGIFDLSVEVAVNGFGLVYCFISEI